MKGLLVTALMHLLDMEGWVLLAPEAVGELRDALRVSEALRSEMVTGIPTYPVSSN